MTSPAADIPPDTGRSDVQVTVIALIGAMCASSGILYGYNLGVIAGAILFVVEDFSLTPALKEFAISASLIGAMAGAVIGGQLADRIGRRKAIVWGGGIGLVAAVVGALSPDYGVLVTHRVAIGISFGILACVTPLYVAEVSPEAIRGRLGALFSVSLMVGLLLAYLSGYAFHALLTSWRWMFSVGVVPALPLLFLVLKLPESPRWLVSQGRTGEAAAAAGRLYPSADPATVVDRLRDNLPTNRARLVDLAHPTVRLTVAAGIGLAVIRQGTGVAVSTFCAPELFEMAGFGSLEVELLGTVGVGVVYVVMTIVALWLVDRHGRRPLLLTGLAGMVLGFLTLWILLQWTGPSTLTGIVATVALMVFVASFAIGPGAVVFLLISELFPQHIRGIGMGVASLALWASYLLSALTFPILVATTGKATPFLVYALLGVAALVFVYRLVPETKGRSLEEIQAH